MTPIEIPIERAVQQLLDAHAGDTATTAHAITSLFRARGWRPSAALTPQSGDGRPAPPEQAHAHAAQARAAIRNQRHGPPHTSPDPAQPDKPSKLERVQKTHDQPRPHRSDTPETP